ncbi:MAG: MFS transporter [Gammaproteobacteria bacterium]|nr:MFS transporter [Gammaproteobacteria bacterium]
MKKTFYGWYVALACAVGLACGLASVITATFSIFLAPLRAEFGWSPPEVFFALFVTTLTVTIAAPFFGALVDRVGARRMILVGLLLEAAVIASFSLQSASLPAFYLRYAVLAVLGLGTTHVAFTRVISVWFNRRRGLALGITLAGLGFGGFLWPLLAQWSIDTYGWREAYLIIAAVIALVPTVIIALVVRDTPQSMGLLPDGAEHEPNGQQARVALAGLTVRAALGTHSFWLMLAAFLLIGTAITSVQVHLVPLLTSRGVTPMRAATALSVLAVALVFGRLAAGWLMDRFFAPRVAIAFLLGPVVAIVLLAAGASGPLAFLAGILTGLAAGAEVDVTAYLTSRYFGLRFFSSIYAFYYSAYSLGAGVGPLLTAQAVEVTGGYSAILYTHAVLVVLAAVLLARLPPFPDWSQGGKH